MTFARFARLNQTIEHLTPTSTIEVICKNWEHFDSPVELIRVLDLDYAGNNLGTRKAVKWIASTLQVFEDEVKLNSEIHMDLGEGIYHFVEEGEDSSYTLTQLLTLLEMDCAKKSEHNFGTFEQAFHQFSSLEKKWFIRFWTQKPRNGLNRGNIIKLLAKLYAKKDSEVKSHCNFNTPAEVLEYYLAGENPPMELQPGTFVSPMLAKVVPRYNWPQNRIYEYKYDGARYQIHKDNQTVIVFNRKGKIVNTQFEDIVTQVSEYPQKKLILDTEIYPVDGGKPAPFQRMGTRIHSKDHQRAMMECPVKLAIFDVLHYENLVLLDEPLSTRLEYLEKFSDMTEYTKERDYKSFYSKAIAEGFEGIMVKNLDAKYQPGKRSVHWAKHKPPRIELDVVITGARYGEGKRGNVFASFDIAVGDSEGGFYSMGSIGTGFKDRDFTSLTNRLRPIVDSYENETYQVRPRIVLEVTSDLISKNADGKYSLRFPRLVRIRDDKPVSDINTIDDVVAML